MTHSQGTWLIHMKKVTPYCRLFLLAPRRGSNWTPARDMTHSYGTWLNWFTRRDSFGWHDSSSTLGVAWLIYMSYMPHSYVTLLNHLEFDSFVCVTSLICIWDLIYSYAWRGLFICVTWLVHMCDMTWLIHMCDTSHQYVRRDSFVCVTWLIHMCDMTHLHWVTRFIHMGRHPTRSSVTWLIHMCDLTHSYVWHD